MTNNKVNRILSVDLKRKLHSVVKPIESAATLPSECYYSEEILAYEKDVLFRQSWIGVGRHDRCKNPGDYVALEVSGIPVILVRGSDHQLRAFANSCRHRNAKLLHGEGNCRAIRCPFHRWTYATDGRLLTAPKMEGAPDFKHGDYGLVPIRLATQDGFVFICTDPKAKTLDDWLGDFPTLHSSWPLAGLATTYRRDFEVNCNWKSFLEVFNEYYHLPYVHPASINENYLEPDAGDTTTGFYTSQFGLTQGTGALLTATQDKTLPSMPDLNGRDKKGARYSWIFPNMTFAAGSECIWVYEVFPITPDRTQVGLTICFPSTTIELPQFEEFQIAYYERFNTALSEDIPALENHHAGLKSPLAQQGRFCKSLEPSVANFARWYATQLLQNL